MVLLAWCFLPCKEPWCTEATSRAGLHLGWMPFETAPFPQDKENYQYAVSCTMEMQLLAQTFLTNLISAEFCFPDPEGQLR